MTEKLPILILYAIAGLLAGLWPTIVLYLRSNKPSSSLDFMPDNDPKVIVTLLAIIGAGLTGLGSAATIKLLLAFVLIIGFAVIRQGRTPPYILAMLAGLLISTTLPWWRRDPWPVLNLSWAEVSFFTITTVSTMWMLNRNKSMKHCSIKHRLSLLPAGIFLGMVFAISFTTGLTTPISWHHWGAYIGPAELLITGARIFFDFPAQYGLGPTLIIAFACGKNCFDGMYYVIGFSTVIYSTLIAYIASGDAKNKTQLGLILIIVFACCFIWISPSTYPSTGGLRFLPVVILVFILIGADKSIVRKGNPASHWPGHIAWMAATLWSPESAFYSTFVWWPYYIFLHGAEASNNYDRSVKQLKALGFLLFLLVLLALSFVAVYFAIYKITPDVYTYFVYALNPPGLLPITLDGAVWFFVFAMLIAFISIYQNFKLSGNSMAFRRSFLLSLMAYASFSYFLGRSHDNNILNLFPFLFLVLLNSYSASRLDTWQRGACVVLISSLLGWAGLFQLPAASQIFDFNSARFREKVSASIDHRNSDDARKIIAHIKNNFHEPITIIDNSMNLTSTDSTSVWNAINGPANFAFIPSERRREYIGKISLILNRSGWLMIDREFIENDWVSDFDSAYKRTYEFYFGSYLVIRYEPRV